MWILKKLFQKREEAAKSYNHKNEEDGEVVKPFLDHLEDLRWMIIKMVLTLGIMMTLGFAFRTQLAHILQLPLIWAVGPVAGQLMTTTPIESISMSFRLAFYAGIVVSFPILMYFLAEFVLPALTKKEKRVVLPAVGIGFLLFLGGVMLAYCVVLPPTLRWLHNDAVTMGADPRWTMAAYYSFVTQLCIALGLIAEMPVVMVTLNGIGVISAKWIQGMRMYGYAASLILAGLISPTPDLFMLFLFAAPMMLLFELCIWLVYFLEKRRNRREALEAARAQIDPNEPID